MSRQSERMEQVLPEITDEPLKLAKQHAEEDLQTYQIHEEIKDVIVDTVYLQRQLLLGNIVGKEREQWIEMLTNKLNIAGTNHWGWQKEKSTTEVAEKLDRCNQLIQEELQSAFKQMRKPSRKFSARMLMNLTQRANEKNHESTDIPDVETAQKMYTYLFQKEPSSSDHYHALKYRSDLHPRVKEWLGEEEKKRVETPSAIALFQFVEKVNQIQKVLQIKPPLTFEIAYELLEHKRFFDLRAYLTNGQKKSTRWKGLRSRSSEHIPKPIALVRSPDAREDYGDVAFEELER